MIAPFAPLVRQCDRAVCFAAGFFETKGAQSMVRAVSLLCAGGALLCALAAYTLTQRPHVTSEHVAMIGELTKMASMFIVGGAVALLVRTRSTQLPTQLPPTG